MPLTRCSRLLLALLAATAAQRAAFAGGAPRIEITFDAAVSAQPYTGRVYVLTSRDESRAPRHAVDWFNPKPFFAQEVVDWQPGAPLSIDPAKCLGYPGPLSELPAGTYYVQAVIDLNGWGRSVINAPGNAYSDAVAVEHDPENPPRVSLRIQRTIPQRVLKDTDDVKFVRIKSKLLSAFHQRNVYLQAAVGLPASYADEPARRYPTIYIIPGFGGTIEMGRMMARLSVNLYQGAGLEIVCVFLDPEFRTGHHVFADSANNGPVGAALVEELIPRLEKTVRLIPDTGARYVTGHSSGGWSSLWLQIAYPDTFGGVWSLAPDPVDFAAFQLVNIYDPKDNFYYEPDGALRASSRKMANARIFAKKFCRMEDVLGRGGQMQSFEAVFSPRGADGAPRKLWDRKSGQLDAETAKAWEKYDIRLVLERNWDRLGPKLAGKLHIICGDADTFYLERAVFRLRDTLAKLGSDAQVHIVPGADHGLNMQVRQQVAREVAEQFRRYQSRSKPD